MQKYLRSSVLAGVLFLSATVVLPGCSVASDVSSSLPAGVQLTERVEAYQDKLAIPYEKFVLDNGLTVILHEDHSDPIAHVDVTYKVGSNREEIGKSGFAHFFEHMMFQGSKNVGDDQHFKIVSEAGGTMNGTTNTDRTNYFQTVPNNQIEKMLWLEADRMGFLLPAITQESFEVQRATVKNERGQNYENRPYGLLRERVGEALYPVGHPYSWSTIGYVEDLDRGNVNDLKAFFLRWYGPNNATLTIGGDFDRDQVLEWVVKYFGPIERGPDVQDIPKTPVTLEADRYISMEDRVSLPLLYKAWPTVYARHDDEAPLDVLMSIIGTGKTSLLYKNLVKEGLAVSASSGHGCQELACSFTISALPNPASETTLTDIDRIVYRTFEEFEARGVEPDDLERLKTSIRTGSIYGLESVSGKVSKLAAWETLFDNPALAQAEVDRYDAVSADDVMRVYRQYIKGKPTVTMSIVPLGQKDAIAKPDSWTRPERVIPPSGATEETDLDLRPVVDSFDRSVQPPAGDIPLVEMPELWSGELENGIEILGTVSTELPTTTISVRMKTGHRNEPLDKLGLASLTASMMNQATQRSSNEDLSNRLQLLGASVGFGSGTNRTVMTVSALTENLDATLDIAQEKLFEPAFEPVDFDRLKAQMIEGIRASKTDAGDVAGTVLSLLLYGRDNAFAYPGSGLEDTVASLTLDDVKQFYADHYSADMAEIVVVSDLVKADMIDRLAVLSAWEQRPVARAVIKPFPALNGGTLYLVDKPDAAQSEIRIATRSLTYDATGEHYLSKLMAYPLGGAFNSRINLNLREDKGYTYGARAGFSAGQYAGQFTASAGVKRDVTSAAITEFFKELEGFSATGMTAEELAFTQAAIGQSDAGDYETARSKAGLISTLLTYDLEPSYRAEQKQRLEALSVEETKRLAQTHLKTEEMIILVVGDKAKILPDLKTLGFPIVELDELARPIGD